MSKYQSAPKTTFSLKEKINVDKASLVINGYEFSKDKNGNPTILLSLTITNNSKLTESYKEISTLFLTQNNIKLQETNLLDDKQQLDSNGKNKEAILTIPVQK